MGRIIPPEEEMLFVSGVTSSSFRKGYDIATKIWDKSKCGTDMPGYISVMKLNRDVYERAILKTEEIHYVERDRLLLATFNGGKSFDERGLYWASSWAFCRTLQHGGDKLVILLKHPHLRIQGIDYTIKEDDWDQEVDIHPGLVKVKKVLAVSPKSKFELTFPENLVLEDITDSFS